MRKKRQFQTKKEEFEQQYIDQSLFLTEKMGPDLSNLAQSSVKHIINSIY